MHIYHDDIIMTNMKIIDDKSYECEGIIIYNLNIST